jgi:hypothetical protein
LRVAEADHGASGLFLAITLRPTQREAFNARMKIKSMLNLIAAASLVLSSTAFAQTAQMTGKVLAVTKGKITVQNGAEVWDINRVPTTKVSGNLKVGLMVTISYNVPDAQKKEGTQAVPSPSAAEK